ncbi:UDP-N-acetylglucosamine 1-carboxyvinyltransferase [Halobacteroides halobius DSM 5150]|uniref:UDP-N-acetylglucosamine 1-carboxyvinyltransferase n=1 Tax=Halobacteroides halobius (strain ATCC 35273 / DSM 5150 / MD-1) TaxID=748449 RepID=L0KD97_HALHC|nr:UDP-N-acetylglucosamine 1-carboxyvinyltransferase [Halobacteroides halobius]AGB42329.1 UDP-N-acetylglucosamine 1-carboxyvinyltransferase [Halobacteroides halobius DSM 5150]
MKRIIINGGNKLGGKIGISGAKNAALPVIMAALMGQGESILYDVPHLRDVNNLIKILNALGAKTEFKDNRLLVNTNALNKLEVPAKLATQMRASYYALGALLGRYGEVTTTLPGGCKIGRRPVDLHLKGFKALGAEINRDGCIINLQADKLIGDKIYLDYPSVGATMNIMMAATMAQGETMIENAAKEPEIVDLASYLNVMGAKVKGAGTNLIRIQGVKKLQGREYTIIPDRIEAGTYIISAAITNSQLYIDNVLVEHINSLLAKLREMGIKIKEDVNGVEVIANKPLNAVDIKTLPYPGFATDLQAQTMALLTQVKGQAKVTETVFEDRFGHVSQLKKMGAKIKVEGNAAAVQNSNLIGARVKATDLRAGASLVLAGLAAEGQTEIEDIYHIKRGYEDITNKLTNVGAKIKEVEQ